MNNLRILFFFLVLFFVDLSYACEKGSVMHPESKVRTCIENLSPKDNLISQNPTFFYADKIPDAWKEFNEGICKKQPDSYAVFNLSIKKGLPVHVELVEAGFPISETYGLKNWLLTIPWLYELTIDEKFLMLSCPSK